MVVVCEGHPLAAQVPREEGKVRADVRDAQRDEPLPARAQPVVSLKKKYFSNSEGD